MPIHKHRLLRHFLCRSILKAIKRKNPQKTNFHILGENNNLLYRKLKKTRVSIYELIAQNHFNDLLNHIQSF